MTERGHDVVLLGLAVMILILMTPLWVEMLRGGLESYLAWMDGEP